MSKFAVGDRVKCVESNYEDQPAGDERDGIVGQVYTVDAARDLYGSNHQWLTLAGMDYKPCSNRFRLHARAGEFVPGDRVVANYKIAGSAGGFEAGDVATVSKVEKLTYGTFLHFEGRAGNADVNGGLGPRFRLATAKEIAETDKKPTHPLAGPPVGGFRAGDLIEAVGLSAADHDLTTGKRYVVLAPTGLGSPRVKTDKGERRFIGEGNRTIVRCFRLISRPDADGWHAWSGGENPVPGMRVTLKYRSGGLSAPLVLASEDRRWGHPHTVSTFGGDKMNGDIVAFKIITDEPVQATKPTAGDRIRVTFEGVTRRDGHVEFGGGIDRFSAPLRLAASVEIISRAPPLAVGDKVLVDGFDNIGEIRLIENGQAVVYSVAHGFEVETYDSLRRAA